MGDYERDEYEDWDEYEEDGEEQEQQEVGEEEYEEETHQPTQEELDYLELRQRLKESIRKKMKKELGAADVGSRDKINGFPKDKDNYGTFFGPRHPAISQRVIQESKSLLENPDLAARFMKPNRANIQRPIAEHVKSKSRDNHPPRVTNGLKKKVEILKNTRDYSFLLSEDADVPASTKSLPPKTVSAPKTDARSAQQLSNRSNKQVVKDHGREPSSNGRDVRKPLPSSSQNKPKVGQERMKLPTKPVVDPRKQLGSSNGSGPGRPVGPKGMPSRSPAPITAGKATSAASKHPTAGGVQKPAPSSMQSAIRKPTPPNMQSGIHKSVPSRVQTSSIMRKPSVQQEYQGSSKPKATTKQSVSSSRDQLRRPPPKAPARHSSGDGKPKAKSKRPFDDEDDEQRAIDMIRSMFRYNPNKFHDDDDDSDMEANFEDIMREEKRSAQIGRQEDEEELRLEEEERRRKLVKKRKLGH